MRLTEGAVGDLQALLRVDPQIVRWALKKAIQIERDPQAGEPLLGGLVGYRKIVVGNRDWRVVWCVDIDEVGKYVVDVAEIWAVGYRRDSEVYAEVAARVAAAGDSTLATALADVLARFAKPGAGLAATPEPRAVEPVPAWLRQALIKVAEMPPDAVAALTFDEASHAWEAHITHQDG